MLTSRFWKYTVERAVKTFAQALAAVLGAGGIGLVDAPWSVALSTAGMATVLSVLTSIGSTRVGEPGTPALVAPDRIVEPQQVPIGT